VEKREVKKIYLQGITSFIVVAASILFFFLIYRFDLVCNGIKTVLNILSPIIFGLVISYLLNPVVDFFNSKLSLLFKNNSGKRKKKRINAISVFLSLVFFIAVIAGIFILIIPAVVDSISNIVEILPPKMDELIEWGEKFLKQNKNVETLFRKGLTIGKKWLETDFAGFVGKSAEYFASGVMGVVSFFKNFVIGLMIAVYLLYNKTRFGNKSRKLMCALFKEGAVKKILSGLHKSNVVFSGFIYGKLLDSLIIGVLCFIGVIVMKIPYSVLISVIIGVTNIIPVFGPYIGAIPCAAIVLITSPIKGLYFIIFIILLQTLDGNFIGPKILGDKTGLETFWVIFAIILGGGMFGVLGMIIGVPLFAVVYYFASVMVNSVLEKKNMSLDSRDYAVDVFGENAKINEAEKNE